LVSFNSVVIQRAHPSFKVCPPRSKLLIHLEINEVGQLSLICYLEVFLAHSIWRIYSIVGNYAGNSRI